MKRTSNKRTSNKRTSNKRTVKRSRGRGGYCQSLLSNKIRTNIREFNSGNSRFKTRESAIAASYSQVQKMFPGCKGVFTRRRHEK
jgi:hypothetical protein